VWGYDYDDTPLSITLTKPDLYQTYIDPAYNTVVTQVTSAEGIRFNRNTYSRRQPENIDATMFFTYHGSTSYYMSVNVQQVILNKRSQFILTPNLSGTQPVQI
jgi:hypothetical protein